MLTGSAREMMRKTQEDAMQHACIIERYIVAEDGTVSYGPPTQPIHCGFKANSGSASYNRDDFYDSVLADAELRLPLGVKVAVKDRVTIISSFGKRLIPAPLYEVSRIPDSFGPSAQTAELMEIYI